VMSSRLPMGVGTTTSGKGMLLSGYPRRLCAREQRAASREAWERLLVTSEPSRLIARLLA
jgi:hypothetical protein